MANNVIEVQLIRDDDAYTTIKVTGVANTAANAWGATYGTLLQANTLFGAVPSANFCPLTLTDLKFSMDVGGAGYIQFTWIAYGNVTNTTIGTFGQIGSATFDGMAIYNNANVYANAAQTVPVFPFAGGGDVGYFVTGIGAGNSFNFILTFAKEKQPVLGNNFGTIYYGNPSGWANCGSWFNA